ncbi:peptidyl-tRNA hydrolase, PTH1 family [Salinimicrobium sediminis]|uniref:Peptidyl-tRNA hydrolase n=1 Tax=Salinimicrobium sediminis TaxID=1343891 RepID=A0A285X2Q5_9FLAO|nr:aminoacyl-tRNA hydrolase [Salinimicrobium sediminis]MDX1753926.1 aminoacyl-tRNA hydrolase [Salinimicrobium sediminis]SOC79623.1 peptidyl-tRNA hydrolase, PTH1 family [Salinimicrobium sediminis]
MLSFFGKIFAKQPKEEIPPMKKFLIVGLGNIGPKYHNTRHNIGFKVLDHLAEKEGLVFESQKLGDLATYKFKGRTFLLLKPSTYMNLSGKAVNYWLQKEKVPLEHLLVITDDLNLPFGTLRVKTKGSDGGHNGLKDIQSQLGTTQYNRFRFGISDEFTKGRQVDYVLGEWDEEENKKLPERLDKSLEIIRSFGTAGINNTMNTFNGK